MSRYTVAAFLLAALVGCSTTETPSNGGGRGIGTPDGQPATYAPPELEVERTIRPLRQEIVVARYDVPEGGAPSYPGIVVVGSKMEVVARVDWEAGTYTAPGMVKVPDPGEIAWQKAERGARATAAGNAVKLAASLRLDEGRLLEVRSGEVGLEAHVQGAQFEIVRQRETMWCCATATVPLSGVSGLVARVVAIERGSYQRLGQAYVPAQKCALAGKTTDVIVDARSTNLEPAILPKIKTADGRIVYDVASVDPAKGENGIAQYAVSDEPLGALLERFRVPAGRRVEVAFLDSPIVLLAQRRGERVVRPVIVKNVDQGQTVDVVVSEADAAKIAAAEEQDGVLKDARVIVVVGSQVAGKRGQAPTARWAVARR